MALIQDWLPPSRENWELVVRLLQFFPLVTIFLWIPSISRYQQMGKTSSNSRFNLPGRIAWITMELPGPLTMLYIMNTLPATLNISEIPWENKVMAAYYIIHYTYRAVIAPLIAPSMSPIAPQVWLAAVLFQITNSLSIAGWLGGYGRTTRAEWRNHGNSYIAGGRIELGMILFFVGLLGNIVHDDELREIRRAAARNQARRAQETGDSEKKSVEKVYMIPQNGMFRYIFYPHYLFEWIEWTGYWIMAGSGCVPARNFVINEVATMLPRAVEGRKWYLERFGAEKVGGRKAIIPGYL